MTLLARIWIQFFPLHYIDIPLFSNTKLQLYFNYFTLSHITRLSPLACHRSGWGAFLCCEPSRGTCSPPRTSTTSSRYRPRPGCASRHARSRRTMYLSPLVAENRGGCVLIQVIAIIYSFSFPLFPSPHGRGKGFFGWAITTEKQRKAATLWIGIISVLLINVKVVTTAESARFFPSWPKAIARFFINRLWPIPMGTAYREDTQSGMRGYCQNTVRSPGGSK